MLIDRFLPRYDVNARYQVDVRAPVERVYKAARSLDMNGSPMIRRLYRLRGLPEDSLTLDGMLKWGFVLLADEPGQEIVFGLIGRFWTRSAGIRSVGADAFVRFEQPGFAKAVGNLAFAPRGDRSIRVTTETRVRCYGNAARLSFRLYWLLVGPFSGAIRREWLRLIKERAEGIQAEHESTRA